MSVFGKVDLSTLYSYLYFWIWKANLFSELMGGKMTCNVFVEHLNFSNGIIRKSLWNLYLGNHFQKQPFNLHLL